MSDEKRKLRSAAWFGGDGKNAFIHRSWMKNQGIPDDNFDGRPVIGICNTWSELTPCNAHLRGIAEHVKRGVYEAGGFPGRVPGDVAGRIEHAPDRHAVPQSRQHGCRGIDPRQPDRRRRAAGGLRQDHAGAADGRGQRATSPPSSSPAAPCSTASTAARISARAPHVWKFSEDVHAGHMSVEEFLAPSRAMTRSAGSCMTMGTASTMASMVEALGIGLPDNAAIPAVDCAAPSCWRSMAGRRIVDLVQRTDTKIAEILTKDAFENAIRVNGAIGGSTNAVLHLHRHRAPPRRRACRSMTGIASVAACPPLST